MKSTNMLERLNEEIRRRTYVVRIFPNTESCLRLVRALAVETNENWMEANRYINMDDLREQIELLESSANLSATIGDFQNAIDMLTAARDEIAAGLSAYRVTCKYGCSCI